MNEQIIWIASTKLKLPLPLPNGVGVGTTMKQAKGKQRRVYQWKKKYLKIIPRAWVGGEMVKRFSLMLWELHVFVLITKFRNICMN